MRKIIAREVCPEDIDFRYYFDNDGFTNAGGKNCAVYVVTKDFGRLAGFNIDEYKEIVKQAKAIVEGFDDIDNKFFDYCSSYKAIMEDNNIPYTSWKCHALKQWAKKADIYNTDCIADYLTIITGQKWETKAFRGYSQGDYCEVVYCTQRYSEEGIEEIGKLWLGCGTEFCIDGCCGYYVIDSIRWTEDERLVNYLAKCYGCKPEQLEVYLYAGSHQVHDYKLLAV